MSLRYVREYINLPFVTEYGIPLSLHPTTAIPPSGFLSCVLLNYALMDFDKAFLEFLRNLLGSKVRLERPGFGQIDRGNAKAMNLDFVLGIRLDSLSRQLFPEIRNAMILCPRRIKGNRKRIWNGLSLLSATSEGIVPRAEVKAQSCSTGVPIPPILIPGLRPIFWNLLIGEESDPESHLVEKVDLGNQGPDH
ncbi:unnamed protein product [Dovyalis caffra]|uniref:Ribosomal protein S3 n=1 Tax=Dovyalis caffra TaxID=77055 RepID=A0AAV1R8C1_9ROSI|nr:unnamed protein product [Dovyalis caffra]